MVAGFFLHGPVEHGLHADQRLVARVRPPAVVFPRPGVEAREGGAGYLQDHAGALREMSPDELEELVDEELAVAEGPLSPVGLHPFQMADRELLDPHVMESVSGDDLRGLLVGEGVFPGNDFLAPEGNL